MGVDRAAHRAQVRVTRRKVAQRVEPRQQKYTAAGLGGGLAYVDGLPVQISADTTGPIEVVNRGRLAAVSYVAAGSPVSSSAAAVTSTTSSSVDHQRLHDINSTQDHTLPLYWANLQKGDILDLLVDGTANQVVGLASDDVLGLLTPSSDGAANHDTLLKSDSAGGIKLDSLRTPLIDTASGNLTLDPAGDLRITDDVEFRNNGFLDPNPFITGFSLHLMPETGKHRLQIGRIEADELVVKLFTADETLVRRGSDWLTPTYATVVADEYPDPPVMSYTVPAENSTVNIWFEDSIHTPGALFLTNEWVLLQFVDRGTGLTVLEIWGQMSGYYTDPTNRPDMQRWTFTNRTAGVSGFEIKPGALFIGFGSSGSGWIYRTVLGGGPRTKFGTWTTNPSVAGNRDTKVQLGDLSDAPDGVFSGISGYGLYAENAYLLGSLYAASGDVVITDEGTGWKAASADVDTWSDFGNKLTWTTDPLSPAVASNVVAQAHALRVDEGGGSYRGRLRFETRTGAGTGLTDGSVDLLATGASGADAHVAVRVDNGDPYVEISALTSGSLQDVNIYGRVNLMGGLAFAAELLSNADGSGTIGAPTHYWDKIYVNEIIGATTIGSETLTGYKWRYDGAVMVIDAHNDGADSVVQIANLGTGGFAADLFVEGDIDARGNILMQPGATIDGVDLSGFYTAHGVHVTAFDDHTAATTAHGATGGVVGATKVQTLTNKTLTTPVIAQIINTGTLTLPTATDTLVGRNTVDTLTNKTLTLPVIAQITNGGTLTLPVGTDTLVGRATTDTLSNKTLTAPTVTGLMSAADATFSGAVGIGGEASGYKLRVVGTTNITGAATLGSTINIAGTVTAQGDVAVGDDLTVADTAIISGVFTAQSDVVLPYWEIDAATGVMQTTGDYAFSPPGATDDYEGIRLTPSSGTIESTYLSASRLATEVLVFELVTVNAGDLIIAKSGGRLREAVSFSGAKYLVDNAGNRIVDHAGNYIILNDGSLEFTIKLEEPPQPGQLLEPGDQIAISGRPTPEIWTRGTNIPYAINRFYPATTPTSELPITVKAIVVSAVEGQSNEYVIRLKNNVYYKSITFPAGAGVANYGQDGDAYLSLKTFNKSAFMDIGTLPGTGWDESLTPFIRLGDIGGLRNVARPGDVGLVGGDINNGVDDYFKIAQDGITLHNGEHVITDANGVRRVIMSTSGLSIKMYEDPLETLANRDDIFLNDEIYQSAITWVDDVDNPDNIYGALYAYKDQSWTGAYDNFVGLEALVTADATSATARLSAGQTYIDATATRSSSSLRIRAQNFLSVDSPQIAITSATAVIIDSGVVRFVSLPTSSSGLPTGAIWNDSGTLKIVS